MKTVIRDQKLTNIKNLGNVSQDRSKPLYVKYMEI